MSTQLAFAHSTTPVEDPYERSRCGFLLRLPPSITPVPLALALRQLPPQDWRHDADAGSWWVAAEHLPVLRRFLDAVEPGPALTASRIATAG